MLLHTWTVALILPLNTGTRHEFFVFLICDHPYIIRYTREESKFKRVAIPRIFGRLHLTGIGNFRFKRIAQFQDGGQFFLIMYGKSNCIVGKIILQFAFWMIAWVYFKDFLHIFNEKMQTPIFTICFKNLYFRCSVLQWPILFTTVLFILNHKMVIFIPLSNIFKSIHV